MCLLLLGAVIVLLRGTGLGLDDRHRPWCYWGVGVAECVMTAALALRDGLVAPETVQLRSLGRRFRDIGMYSIEVSPIIRLADPLATVGTLDLTWACVGHPEVCGGGKTTAGWMRAGYRSLQYRGRDERRP